MSPLKRAALFSGIVQYILVFVGIVQILHTQHVLAFHYATFDSSSGRLFFPEVEVSSGQSAFSCTNAEFELESADPYRFTLVSFDSC